MNKLTVIMKVTDKCNLKCKHCYEADNELCNTMPVMSTEVLEKTIKKVQQSYQSVTYIWFGGEPLLAGIDFFEKAVAFQKKYNKGNIINNRIQTNGIKINKIFIEFLKKYDYNVSVSFDGLYNHFLRQETEKVLQCIELCRQLNLPLNVISTVCAKTCDKQIENYEYFKKLKLPMKFNPIFPAGAAKVNSEFLLDEKLYFEETIKFFKYWIRDEKAVPVSTFIQYIKMFLNYPGKNCVYGACLYTVIDIEPNGDILPCSRYSTDEYIVGNINDIENFEDVFKSGIYEKIVLASIERRKKCKEECKLYSYCLGGCSSACANETELKNNNTQLCRITKNILPIVFEELDIICNGNDIRNPILKYLYQGAENR
jgi:radical SAM domain protein